ncbi:uncharacterized protein LTR77_000803 [Saxophila tyrrhenica]|uniref:chitin synthase n=1 Tax=Saxophila tyrrhenica TaxID=1690608 RepID=A0AAV9PP22_9PEZI|nr:hypothetical protein LTR77_000803 [Saxophila tyrrhenica]
MANRYSSYSSHSGAGQRTNTMQGGGSHQVSTTSLLAQLNTCFANGQPYPLESSTSLVVNTWASGEIIDEELARKAWEHARRRAEDGCIVLGSLHRSTPSLLQPFATALPLSVPNSFYTAVNALRPFLQRVTPYNPSEPCYSALAATFTLSLEGEIQGASLSLSTSGIDTQKGLLNVPAEHGNRAFDVFYYLLTSSTNKERDALGLKTPNQYALLRKSETYTSPLYLPTGDDAASAEDWRESLKMLGIKGADFRNLLTTVSAILRLGDAVGYLVDQEELGETCEEVGSLLDIEPDVLLKKCVTEEREILIAAIYEALVDWIIVKINDAIRTEMRTGQAIGSGSSDGGINTPPSSQEDGVCASITVVEVPSSSLGKAVSLKTIFDDSTGINAEMKEDGVQYVPAGSSVQREMKEAFAQNGADLNEDNGPAARDRELALDRRQTALEKIGEEAESDSFMRRILYPVSGQGINLGKTGRFNLRNTMESSRVWFHLCLHPTEDSPATVAQQSLPWSAGSVSSQIRAWRLPEWANHRNKQLDLTADFDIDEFVDRYSRLGCHAGREGVEAWIMERGWSNGEVIVGHERIWMREQAWWEAESMLDMKPIDDIPAGMLGGMIGAGGLETGYSHQSDAMSNPFFSQQYETNASQDNLASGRASQMAPSYFGGAKSIAPTAAPTTRTVGAGDYGLGRKGDNKYADVSYEGEIDPELAEGKEIEVEKTSFGRRVWVAIAWAVTFWMPSFLLKHVGRMKRPDVRLAWREKVTLVLIILLINGTIIFWIVGFGDLICPNWDKVWDQQEVGYHQGEKDYWVSWRGGVYDMTDFWRLQHSDTNIQTTSDLMLPFAGTDVTDYIVPPLWLACPGLVDSRQLAMTPNKTLLYPQATHPSGEWAQPDPGSKLHNNHWYDNTLIPKMKEYWKGDLVTSMDKIKKEGENSQHYWFVLNKKVYDLTDYFSTLKLQNNLDQYKFLGDGVTELVQSNPGKDITELWENSNFNRTYRGNTLNCLDNMFYAGKTDFRDTARCQVNNYILLAFTIIICVVIGVKFLAALQLGSKRRPAQQDKFVICQVPAYTEGEESLRKGLDSLTALAYDNKRKLICVICDGMIVGGGNDRPTPKIVLDVLGVDPKIDPPALPFKSVGNGSEQLNYGKVYSGLYEYEGNVVPYIVVVKVGKQSEQSKSKPGNRGKRDSQILLMSFLNRVHHRAPMNPLELEIFHQINNIIGVDPELYEYLFMVDADTKVKEDSLNRLVASCANDGKIAGICGETSLENEERSWWTMIQVYEYFISHHLAKAFESLFGSVTCLPGCFCMYRLRTADKGRPLIISDKVIHDYADNQVDTLHKKNLLSLGEDRYLTTLMTKHFPQMSYKFVPDAYALTEAPAEWSVLLSQRRRWINSTIHNLAELVWLKDLCGFCCFSMRFVVFIDLFGTIILPATCGYLVYLIYNVASGTGQFPLISIVMLSAVYGLQAVIFIVKRQWQHIGWMIIYILAYPIWSLILPVYSFWKQDDFSWGNTRVVLGERGDKKVVATEDEGYDPRSIPLQRWDDYAGQNNLPGRRGLPLEKEASGYYETGPGGYEMDDIHSVYSSVKPASTILTGMPGSQMYRPPQSPAPFRQTGMTGYASTQRYTDLPTDQQSRLMSMGGMSDQYQNSSRHASRDNLLSMASPHMQQQPDRSRSPFPLQQQSRPASTLHGFQQQGPSNEAISAAIRECLGEVDLDRVTKKQLKALAEQKLQCQLVGERRAWLDERIDFELANM